MDELCTEANGNFAVGKSCAEYVNCRDGKVNYQTDCAPNYYFHADLQGCTDTIPSDCVPEPDPDVPVNLCVR